MEALFASVDDFEFEIERVLARQAGGTLEFANMDKSNADVCRAFLEGRCDRGANCPYRHLKKEKITVCKHWLRSLCKKGDGCEFLHQYDMAKMPVCQFFSQYGQCRNGEACPFLHIDPETKKSDCPWYAHGFCKHGPDCRHRHVKRAMCPNFLTGFCPDGPKCKLAHPNWEITNEANDPNRPGGGIVCHRCGQPGHKLPQCPLNAQNTVTVVGGGGPQAGPGTGANTGFGTPGGFRPRGPPPNLADIVCYKCQQKGHYANYCPNAAGGVGGGGGSGYGGPRPPRPYGGSNQYGGGGGGGGGGGHENSGSSSSVLLTYS